MEELKIPYESRKVHFNSHASHIFFPMNGLAGVVKKNSTMSREAANGGIKNSLWITKGTLQFPCKSWIFPMNGLAGVVKKKSIMSGEAANDGFFFTTTAKPWMGKNCDAHGNCNVPWVMNREFFPFQIPKMIGSTFLLKKWHFRLFQGIQF